MSRLFLALVTTPLLLGFAFGPTESHEPVEGPPPCLRPEVAPEARGCVFNYNRAYYLRFWGSGNPDRADGRVEYFNSDFQRYDRWWYFRGDVTSFVMRGNRAALCGEITQQVRVPGIPRRESGYFRVDVVDNREGPEGESEEPDRFRVRTRTEPWDCTEPNRHYPAPAVGDLTVG